MRGAVGFFTFFAAFLLKTRHEPAWIYGLVLMMSAVGTGIGSVIAPFLKRRTREEWILAGALVLPSVPLVLAAHSFGRPALVFAAAAIAASSATGRLAFDSLLQRDGSDAARGPRVRTVRDALPAGVGARRPARGHLSRRAAGSGSSSSRSCCCSPGSRTSGAVRRPGPDDVRPAAAPADDPEPPHSAPAIRSPRSTFGIIVVRPKTGPTRRNACPSTFVPSRPTNCRPCSRSTGAASAHRAASPSRRQLGDRRAAANPVRVRRGDDGRVHPFVHVRADDAWWRARSGGRRVVRRGAADAPAPGRAQRR